MPDGVEGREQEQKDHPDRDRDNNFQTGHSALHVFERAAPNQMIAGRYLHLPGNLCLSLSYNTFNIATQRVETNIDSSLQPLATDQRRSLPELDSRQLAQWNESPGRGRQ